MASSTPPLYTYALLASLKGGSFMRHSPHSLSSPTPDTKGTPQSVHRGLEMRCLENAEEQSRHRGACPAATSSSHAGHTVGKKMSRKDFITPPLTAPLSGETIHLN